MIRSGAKAGQLRSTNHRQMQRMPTCALVLRSYCGIATVLSIVQLASEGTANVDYTVPPPSVTSTTAAVFATFSAISTVMFSYGGHNIALEVCGLMSIAHVHSHTQRLTTQLPVRASYQDTMRRAPAALTLTHSLLQIQATLPCNPSSIKPMMKGVNGERRERSSCQVGLC